MTAKARRSLLCGVLAAVMFLSLLVPATLGAAAAGNVNVDFLILEEDGVQFMGGGTGFRRHTVAAGGTVDAFEELWRDDSLNYRFDGWYTAPSGGEKVTASTTFDDYTVLFDRWIAEPVDNDKVIHDLQINNPNLFRDGQTVENFNAGTDAPIVDHGTVSGGDSFVFYDGLNGKGNVLPASYAFEAGKNYSAVTQVYIPAGYYVDRNIASAVSVDYGIRADVRFSGAQGEQSIFWGSETRRLTITINFPYYGFVSAPANMSVANKATPDCSWQTTFPATEAYLMHKRGEGIYNYIATIGTEFQLPAFSDSTQTFVIFARFPAGGEAQSEEFTVVYGDGVSGQVPQFTLQPADADLALEENYQVPYVFGYPTQNQWLDWRADENDFWHEKVAYADSNGILTVSGYDFAFSRQYRVGVSYLDPKNNNNMTMNSEPFTVRWVDTATSWTVHFEPYGGTGTMADAAGVAGDYVLPECAFTAPAGKVFANWLCGGVYYPAGAHVTIDRATTFLAIWKDAVKDTYFVKFNANGGTGAMSDVLAAYGEEFTLPDCAFTAPAGQKFENWWVSGVYLNAGDTVTVTKDLTVVANWIDDAYTVTFNANGGTGDMDAAADVPAAYVLPDCTFEAPGAKHFIGWAVGAPDATPVGAGKTVKLTQNTTLYAVWDDNEPQTVTYDSNGTTVMYVLPEGTNFTVATFDSLGFTAPAGKTFSHWKEFWTNTDDIAPGSNYVVPDDGIYFRAIFVSTGEAVYTIQFSNGGQSGEMAPVDVVAGTVYTLPKPDFTAPAGTEFIGWSVGGDVSVLFDPGETVTIETTTDLAAVWRTPAGIEADYAGEVIVGHSADPDAILLYLVYDNDDKVLMDPLTANYADGATPIDIGAYVFGEAKIGMNPITVTYGPFEATLGVRVVKEYLVTYDGNGGNGAIDPEALHDPEYILKQNAFVAPTGTVFKCWSVGGQEYAPGAALVLTGNTTVQAVWENLYTVSVAANGGTGNTVALVTKAGAYTLPACGFTAPAGKQFKGWALTANGNVITAPTVDVTADTTLYAIWENVPAPEPHHATVDGVEVYDDTLTAGVAKDVSAIFAAAKGENGKVELTAGTLTLTFDAATVAALGGETVSLSASVATENLTIAGAQMAIEVTLTGASADFGGGKVRISVPFTTAVPNGKAAKVYYVNGNDKTDMNATFANGKVTFDTNHFSTFAVVVEDAAQPPVTPAPNTTPAGTDDPLTVAAEKKGLSGGAVAGIVIGVVVVLAAAGACCFFLLKKKGVIGAKAENTSDETAAQSEETAPEQGEEPAQAEEEPETTEEQNEEGSER